ncbi:MAG: His/Gly/Thr/Pro-type tRNA ligase C-terminal domain-containing protein, partial [Candidatus Levyibacteriota bacterium]
AQGEGAFYGPKIDILMKDSLGREWQTGTIQLDFQQPKNFSLSYIDENGKEVQPVTIHKAIFGSFERFLGILVENFEGKLPLWLAPVQAKLLPIADRHVSYAKKVAEMLLQHNIRAEADDSSERLQAKIRNSTLQKVPFMGIIGDKEIEGSEDLDNVSQGKLSIRERNGNDLGSMTIEKFISLLKEKIDKKVS